MWTQQPPAAASQEPTTVAGVEVTARGAPPKVVATYPAAGQAAPPGILVLMVRFDHRMWPDGWDYGTGPGQPACLGKPRLLADERTFVRLCSVGFSQSFSLELNGAKKGFQDAAKVAAQPVSLAFTTSSADPTASLADALKAAGLSEVDSPILDSQPLPPGGG